ncbi:MAG: hypothetical protein EZS28_045389, partial [Streblomastix strix]
VYQVYKEDTNIIAAKVMLRKDFSIDEWNSALKLMRNENPFMLKYHSANFIGDIVIILMEYANMQSLENLIESEKELQISTIRVIMKQLLEEVCTIHKSGFIHRDIKGQNILLHSTIGSQKVMLKIADLGTIKEQLNPYQTALFIPQGTPNFMAPELLIDTEEEEETKGQVKADAKIDIWAVGIIFHQLLTHHFPFKQHKFSSIM